MNPNYVGDYQLVRSEITISNSLSRNDGIFQHGTFLRQEIAVDICTVQTFNDRFIHMLETTNDEAVGMVHAVF